ncbi:uncharacterized protein LOC135163387 [Diachasmimorpha longicaudata]|uniref:uncharacterized protein LOC135163387 n=1 Tax=Diachasmimorpha longicaudata TaxID=58733 RepID=UPI0030B89A62
MFEEKEDFKGFIFRQFSRCLPGKTINEKKKFSDHSRTVNSEICDERTVSNKKVLSYSDTQEESAHYSQKPQQRSQPSPSSTTNKTGSYDDLSESLSSKERKDSEKLTFRRKERFSATPFGRPLQSRNRPIPMTFPRSKSSLDFSDHVATSRRNSDQSVDFSKYLRNLTSALGQVQGLLVKVHDGQQGIKDLLADPRNVRGEYQPIATLKDYYCEDINKFQQFNKKLEEERDFREKIGRFYMFLFDGLCKNFKVFNLCVFFSPLRWSVSLIQNIH